MSSSLTLVARRASATVSRRLPTMSRQVVKVALSTHAKKVNETIAYKPDSLNDTHMHDQFEILETMLEKNLHMVDEDAVAELRTLLKTAPMAVDAPDGDSDGHLKEEMLEIQRIFKDVEAHKDEIKARLARVNAQIKEAQKIYAVDGPDGEDDGHIAEEMEEIKHIIEDAAAHEDKEAIEYQHKMDDAVRKERARDPEHDW